MAYISLSPSLSLSLNVEIIVAGEQYVVLRREMARRVMRDSNTRFDVLLSEEVCAFQRYRCS